MPKDKTATHAKVMEAARQEFLVNGYEKASMRAIADRCGITAAGIYRHCRDKEDLFHQIVSPAVDNLKEWLENHVSRYSQAMGEEQKTGWQDSWVDMMREVVYPHMEDYHLLLVKSQGSEYGNFLQDMTERIQQRFWEFLPCLRSMGYPVWDISAKELHLLLTAYMSALFEPVIHNYSLEEALNCLDTVEAFFLPGWKKLIGF